MTRINILIVGMSPGIGGIETLIIRLIREIDNTRFQFDILTFCPKCAYEEELELRGCQVFHAVRRGKNPLRNYVDQWRFFSQHRDIYNYVWLHLSSASDLNTILLTKKYTTAKVICHSHGTFFESRGGLIRRLHLFLHNKNRPRLISDTDLYFACSEKAGKHLFGDIGEKLVVIPNGIDISEFCFNSEKREALRKSLDVNSKIVIGHVGRLTAAKNQTFLLDVFAEFHHEHQKSVLMIVGTGELEAVLRKKANQLGIVDCVKFFGFRQDVSELLQVFDVFVLPSLYEGMPITLIEAQTCGLPCVISDTITRETAVTDLVHFVSIQKPPTDWVMEIEIALKHSREFPGYKECMIKSGYSIQTTIERLSDILGGKA